MLGSDGWDTGRVIGVGKLQNVSWAKDIRLVHVWRSANQVRKGALIFMKPNMTTNRNTSCNRIKTSIFFVMSCVAQEYTMYISRLKFIFRRGN